jgi:hypothetical protein
LDTCFYPCAKRIIKSDISGAGKGALIGGGLGAFAGGIEPLPGGSLVACKGSILADLREYFGFSSWW